MTSTMGAAGSLDPPPDIDIVALKTKLYDACLNEADGDMKTVFHQNSIFELEVIPDRDVMTLLSVAQRLVDEKLFKPVNDITGLGWMLRTIEEARKYRSLTTEQEIVYAIIDEAGEEGVWTKTIKIRSNLHEAVYKAAIKFLEGRNMIVDMKSVEHPARKMYIKMGARLSDRATGGPWFTDGQFDEGFIEIVMRVLYVHIKNKTFYHASSSSSLKRAKKTIRKPTTEEAQALRAKVLGPRVKFEEDVGERATRQAALARFLPMPVGYTGYPTLDELTHHVLNSGATKQTLTAGEIQQLLDILVFDDKIERILCGDTFAYRALRKPVDDDAEIIGKPITEAPCGRCPVFDLCEEGGPVGPSNCEYFNEWLTM